MLCTVSHPCGIIFLSFICAAKICGEDGMVDPNCFVIAQSVVFTILEQQWVSLYSFSGGVSTHTAMFPPLPCFDIKIKVQPIPLSFYHFDIHSSACIHLPLALSFPGTLANSCGAIISVNTRSKCWRVAPCSWLTSYSASQLSSTSLRWVGQSVQSIIYLWCLITNTFYSIVNDSHTAGEAFVVDQRPLMSINQLAVDSWHHTHKWRLCI